MASEKVGSAFAYQPAAHHADHMRIVLAGNQTLNGNGALALVTFDLKPKAPVGDSALRLAEAALYDLHGRHFVRNFSNNVVERRNGLLTVIGQTINQIYLPVLSR